ncbi:hypothetical protein NDU88_004563 [Pleurodeles waltl]|uniref:Uncharacterized protein n=1 Tax=Pleurodeles waltl TaxID=8319 RepID=A0AAV7RLB9_PLEWA|nr:hypothetical protein NDU88_004563 [Pleurodeles waltl]
MRTRGHKGAGAGAARASLAKGARAHQVLLPQAPLAVESEWEQEGQPFEERQLGGAAKMAAPSDLRELSVGEENLMDLSVEEENFSSDEGSHMFMAEQDNKAVIVIDSEEEGEVLELQVEEGSAQLGQKVLGQEQRAYLSGCVAPHVSSGHGVLIEHQRSGRSAGGPVTVGVRAPPGHRIEERAQSGAVRLTAREVTPIEVRSVKSNARGLESRSYSRSAMLTGEEEEELDYDEDGEQVEAPQASTSGQAFRGERLSRRDVAANLSRALLGRGGPLRGSPAAPRRFSAAGAVLLRLLASSGSRCGLLWIPRLAALAAIPSSRSSMAGSLPASLTP